MLLKEFLSVNGGDGSVNYGKVVSFYHDKVPFIHKIEELLGSMGFVFNKVNRAEFYPHTETIEVPNHGGNHDECCHEVKGIVNADPETVRMHFTSKGFNPDAGLAQDKSCLTYGALKICICNDLIEPGKTLIKLC